jgi:hypothetical protein
MKLSFSNCKCPRCQKDLSIELDECDLKNYFYTGFCYDSSHPRLKIKTLPRLRMENKSHHDEKYSMSGLTCIFCGGKMWFNKFKSHVAGNLVANDCPQCKIGLLYLGKLVNTSVTHEEIMRIKITTPRYEGWQN